MSQEIQETLSAILATLQKLDGRITDIETNVRKTKVDKLAAYRTNMTDGVETIYVKDVKSTDNVVTLAPKIGAKSPIFRMTAPQFTRFMQRYNAADDGDSVPLDEGCKFMGKFVINGTWPELVTA